MSPIRTVIMGAAGRDFHNFNVVYRDNPAYDVVAFTAAQIPNIDGRKYPASLAGRLYPKGIPILAEADLEAVIRDRKVQEVVFSYSDVSYAHVLGLGAVVNAAGAHFKLLGAGATMLKSAKPVIAVCAVRTGSGKSQTTRRIARMLREQGFTVAAVRHPMPYGNLERQRVQRYAALSDLKAHRCTIEEIEEYEPHIVSGTITYAGVDYGDILAQARRHPLGRRQQRHALLPPRRPHRRGRPPARGPRAGLLPRRDEPAHGRRGRHQQGGNRGIGRRQQPPPSRRPTRRSSPAGACSSSRTGRR